VRISDHADQRSGRMPFLFGAGEDMTKTAEIPD
jgi:hypothetical protein